MVNIPLNGTPGIFDARNPTLVPNFDKSVASSAGTVDHQSPAAFLAANPRVNAAATATIGGTVTTSDQVMLVLSNAVFPSGQVAVTYTTLAGDSVTNIAENLADLINDNATLQGFGVEADVAGAVVTINQSGPVGNFSTLTSPLEEPSKIVITGSALTGDVIAALFTGPAIGGSGVLITSNSTTGHSTTTQASDFSGLINANATLSALSITSTPSTNNVNITVPAAAEPVAITAWANTITPTATITNSVAAGDIINITITSPAIAGGSATVSYTALLGDTTTSVATGLKLAINNSPALIAAGITATSASNVVTFLYQAAGGSIRFSSSVSPGSETVTFTTTPSEVLTVSTRATETVLIGSGSTAVLPAHATALITGTTFNDTDTVAITFTNAGVTGFPVTITYTLSGGSETASSVAAGLNTLINANATLKAANVSSTVSTATLTINQQGSIGNTTVLTTTIGGTGDEGITYTPSNGHLGSGAGVVGNSLSGGSGPIVAANNFTFAHGGQTQDFLYGQPYLLGYNVITAMVAQGMPIV